MSADRPSYSVSDIVRRFHGQCTSPSEIVFSGKKSKLSGFGSFKFRSKNIYSLMLSRSVRDSTENNMPTFEINKLLTITEVARAVGVSVKTIIRWEKLDKIRKAKRNWRGWRIYDENDLIQIRSHFETIFEV